MKLKIFGSNIRVKMIRGMIEVHGLRGLYQPALKVISIDSDQPKEDQMQTLLHEVVHVVINRIGIDQAKISEGVEEIICESVATALIENFKIKPL